MKTTLHPQTHSKRYVMGMAVMALATFKPSNAQETSVAPSPAHSSLIELAAQAEALGNTGHYEEQLAVLEQTTAILVQDAPTNPGAATRQAEMDALLDLGLRLDGAGHPQNAIHTLEQALALTTSSEQYSRYLAQLALAHAQQDAGDSATSRETCAAADPESVPDGERRKHLLGTRAVLVAQKDLFCGDPALGQAMLTQELAQHPHMAAPHQVLSEYDLATHDWPAAAKQFALWKSSPEVEAALGSKY